MFFGYSKNGTQRNHAWVKQGMIFPFTEFMDRYQGQTQLYKSKRIDFDMALEEALLAENGILDTNIGANQGTYPEANPNGIQEATASNLADNITLKIRMNAIRIQPHVTAVVCFCHAKLQRG